MTEAEAAQTPEVLAESDGEIALAILNRPKTLNALSKSLMASLTKTLERFDVDSRIRAMIVTGSARAFSAGADIGEMKSLADARAAREILADHLSAWDKIGRLRKPVIAAVSGFALGGGCELAMACDMIVACETAVFGQPEALIGVMPGAGGTQRLAKLVGKSLAMEMVLAGRRLSAREALAAGLVSRVVAPEVLIDEAKRLAREIAKAAPLAAQAAKAAVNAAVDRGLVSGLVLEREAFYRLFGTRDQKEGMRAFAEKRPPSFEGA